MKFPDWAPPEVIDIWRALRDKRQLELSETIDFLLKTAERKRQLADVREVERMAREWIQEESITRNLELLHRLLTYPDMDAVWKKLQSLKTPRNFKSSNAEVFARAALAAFHGPAGSERKTPKQRGEWLNEIRDTAIHLARLVECSEFDDFLIHQHQKRILKAIRKNAAKILIGGEPSDMKDWPAGPGLISDTLRALAESVPEIARKPLSDRPGAGEQATRIYFVRFLTDHLRKSYGQPLRKVVMLTTIAAFNNPDFTERQVIRIAP